MEHTIGRHPHILRIARNLLLWIVLRIHVPASIRLSTVIERHAAARKFFSSGYCQSGTPDRQKPRGGCCILYVMYRTRGNGLATFLLAVLASTGISCWLDCLMASRTHAAPSQQAQGHSNAHGTEAGSHVGHESGSGGHESSGHQSTRSSCCDQFLLSASRSPFPPAVAQLVSLPATCHRVLAVPRVSTLNQSCTGPPIILPEPFLSPTVLRI